jgi:hypothetical protein
MKLTIQKLPENYLKGLVLTPTLNACSLPRALNGIKEYVSINSPLRSPACLIVYNGLVGSTMGRLLLSTQIQTLG